MGHICSVMIVYPEIAFAFYAEGHAAMFCKSGIHLGKISSGRGEKIFKKGTCMVEKADASGNCDNMIGGGERIEIEEDFDFGFSGLARDGSLPGHDQARDVPQTPPTTASPQTCPANSLSLFFSILPQ